VNELEINRPFRDISEGPVLLNRTANVRHTAMADKLTPLLEAGLAGELKN
jgi:hypothetical protein